MFRRTEVWSIPEFIAGQPAARVEGGLSRESKITLAKIAALGLFVSLAIPHAEALAASPDAVPVSINPATLHGPVSSAFDRKIWPLLLDIGQPLSKTMMAIGIYKCIRNDVDRGWKMVWRSGVGLVGLFLIDGAIHIISGVGSDLSNS